jgi:hypothetical protein
VLAIAVCKMRRIVNIIPYKNSEPTTATTSYAKRLGHVVPQVFHLQFTCAVLTFVHGRWCYVNRLFFVWSLGGVKDLVEGH